MKNSHASRFHRGFTLVELMIVMTVILILMTLTVAVWPWVAKQVHKLETKNKINTLEQIVKKYYEHYGVYPPSSELIAGKVDDKKMMDALNGVSAPANSKDKLNLGVQDEQLKDGFGNYIIFLRVWDDAGNTETPPQFLSDPRPAFAKDPTNPDNLDQLRRVNYFFWSLGPNPTQDKVDDDIFWKQG